MEGVLIICSCPLRPNLKGTKSIHLMGRGDIVPSPILFFTSLIICGAITFKLYFPLSFPLSSLPLVEYTVRKEQAMIRSVVRDLRELGKRLSALPKSSEKNKHLIEGALYGASAAQTELQNALRKVSVHINGVYVLRPPRIDHLSNVFLKLYTDAKDRKAVLRKQEIMQLAKQCFKKEMSETEYALVVNDLCIITEDGGLMLKSGD